ncbi:MAG: hypothetical protein Q7U36_04895 [bacterium]|nr:hypothetical protein [bacterium]
MQTPDEDPETLAEALAEAEVVVAVAVTETSAAHTTEEKNKQRILIIRANLFMVTS